jgi:hypothetical protein
MIKGCAPWDDAAALGFIRLPSLLSADACARWARRVDAELDGVEFGRGLIHTVEVPELSACVRPCLAGHALTVSDVWRLMRYCVGQGTGPHQDGTVKHPSSPARGRSCASLLIYLDDGFEGGRTCFVADPRTCSSDSIDMHVIAAVTPRAGDGVLLRPDVWHMGETVEHGVKHLLRADVWAA